MGFCFKRVRRFVRAGKIPGRGEEGWRVHFEMVRAKRMKKDKTSDLSQKFENCALILRRAGYAFETVFESGGGEQDVVSDNELEEKLHNLRCEMKEVEEELRFYVKEHKVGDCAIWWWVRKIVALVMLFCLVMGPALKPNPIGWVIQQCWNMRDWLAEYGVVGHYDAMECDYRLYDCNVPM